MWPVAIMLDSIALAHHSDYLNSGEHVQTEKFNMHIRLDIPASSHTPLILPANKYCKPLGCALFSHS